MGFVLPFCLALSKKECKGIIYYNPFRIHQMLHVLCNYNTFDKLFLPTHMLGKSSNCAKETFLHKVNFLAERNCELDLGLQDLQALLSPWDTSTQPRTHISASLGSRTIPPVLYTCQNSSCTGSSHTPDHNTDAVQPMQALTHAPTMTPSECKCQMCWPMPSITSDKAHSPKQNKRTLTSTTPPQAPGQPAGHESWPQGPVQAGCAVLHATTLDLATTSSTRGPYLWSWTQTSFVICMRLKFASSMGSPETSIFQLFPTLHRKNGSSCDEWELPPEYPSRGRRGVYGEHVGSYGETEEGMPQSAYSTTWEKNKPPSNNGVKKEVVVRKNMMIRAQVQKNGGGCSRQSQRIFLPGSSLKHI